MMQKKYRMKYEYGEEVNCNDDHERICICLSYMTTTIYFSIIFFFFFRSHSVSTFAI